MMKQISLSVWALLLGTSIVSGVRAEETPTERRTFVVQDGAFPWYDRTKGSKVWMLDGVPESLKATTPLPQQNCSSRALEILGTPQAVTIGVSRNDLKRFKEKYSAATETGEDIAVKNLKGERIGYRVLIFLNPPAHIGEEVALGGGLLLLKMNGSKSAAPDPTAPKAGQPKTPVLPINAAPTPGAAQGNDMPMPSAALPSVAHGVSLPAKEKLHIYLLMGQSNMVGRDTRTLGSPSGNPHVLSLNGQGQWVIAKDPLHEDKKIAPGVGPGLSFALEMAKADPEIVIGLVPCAVGNTPLSRWSKGGDLYDKAVGRGKAAAQVGVLKGVLWHQGEAETSKIDNAETYGARLSQMFKDLREDLGVPTLPIVVGQLGEFLRPEKHVYAGIVRSAIKQVSISCPAVGFADAAGLGDKGDKLHFSAEAEKTLGRRYAQAMQEVQKAPEPGSADEAE